MLTVIALLVGLGVGAVSTAVWLRASSASALRRSEEERRRLVADAEREAETIRREALVEAREGAVKLRAEVESEVQDRIASAFNNAGLVEGLTGRLNLSGGGGHTGTFSAAPGPTVVFGGGTHQLNSGVTFIGSGHGVSGGTTNKNLIAATTRRACGRRSSLPTARSASSRVADAACTRAASARALRRGRARRSVRHRSRASGT